MSVRAHVIVAASPAADQPPTIFLAAAASREEALQLVWNEVGIHVPLKLQGKPLPEIVARALDLRPGECRRLNEADRLL